MCRRRGMACVCRRELPICECVAVMLGRTFSEFLRPGSFEALIVIDFQGTFVF